MSRENESVGAEVPQVGSGRPDGGTLLSARDLTVCYGSNEALHPTSLDFAAGQVTALIGPSGCGKSTFLRCLNLMNREIPKCKIGGEVLYHGRNINTRKENLFELRKSIGMVFQQPTPFRKSIRDNILFAPKRHGLVSGKEDCDALVEQSLRGASLWEEVRDRLKKSALGLSGGQQQRLCIARALAVQPDVLLMDEPTSALDPASTIRIEELMAELKKNYTVVIVTHNMQQAARVSDKTGFFMLGELVEYNDTKKMFLNPDKVQTQNYITGRFG